MPTTADSFNRPDSDSPSVFCRLLDKNRGGYFSISPPPDVTFTTKQSYLPSSNVLLTRYMNEDGVADLVDFFPRVSSSSFSHVTCPSGTIAQ